MSEPKAPSRKMQLAKYLARDEKVHKDNPSIKTYTMEDLKTAMGIIDEFCIEQTGKSTKELTSEEQDKFYTWCEQKTPFEKSTVKVKAVA